MYYGQSAPIQLSIDCDTPFIASNYNLQWKQASINYTFLRSSLFLYIFFLKTTKGEKIAIHLPFENIFIQTKLNEYELWWLHYTNNSFSLHLVLFKSATVSKEVSCGNGSWSPQKCVQRALLVKLYTKTLNKKVSLESWNLQEEMQKWDTELWSLEHCNFLLFVPFIMIPFGEQEGVPITAAPSIFAPPNKINSRSNRCCVRLIRGV